MRNTTRRLPSTCLLWQCASCKRIEDENGDSWDLHEVPAADSLLTHLCAECRNAFKEDYRNELYRT